MSDKASIIEEGRASIRSKASSVMEEGGLTRRSSKRSSIASSVAASSVKGTIKQPPTRQPEKAFDDTDNDGGIFDDDDDGLTDRERKIKAFKTVAIACCKSCFGSLGLMIGVIAYSILGGYIFNQLEAENEIKGCTNRKLKYEHEELIIVSRLREVADGGNGDQVMESYKKLLRRFRQMVYEVDYSGDNCTMLGKVGHPNLEWSVSGATMFAVTITTTIGYGHIAPKTLWGRMVCIAYAVLGIPLMLLFLANIGDVLADFFRFFYTKICCCGCCKQKDNPREAQEEVTPTWSGAPGDPKPPVKEPIIIEDEEEDDFDDDNITIPLTVTLCLITGYIMLGAVLFKRWEGWDLSEAAYFSFVTLSTVGFGDYVPGKNGFDDPKAQIIIIMGAIYMVFGMAILSMCFTLIQDEIAAKFAWIATKLGVADKTPPPEEEEEQ